MTMLDTTVLICVNRVDIMISQWTFASYISGSSFSYQWHLYPLYAQFLIDSWTHISYLHPWNGHFIPAGVNRSIPARMEQFILAGIKWAILFRPDWMVHFIPTGMDLFTPAGTEWAIPFLLEWNNIHFIPVVVDLNILFQMVSFVPYCHQTFCLNVLFRKITPSYQMQRCIRWIY